MFIIDLIASSLINSNFSDYSCSSPTLDRRNCAVVIIDNSEVKPKNQYFK